jgi:outer membrane immunogenic protein
MKKSLIGIVAIGALIAGPAMAANLPVKAPPPAPAPACMWCGWYIGANIGGIWEHDAPNVTFVDNGSGATAAAAAGAIPLAFASDRSGVIGGGQLGYNWQVGTFVVGLETDLDGTGLRGGQTINTAVVPAFFALTESVSQKMGWIGTTRVRLGLPFNNVLVYGTGGVAYAGLHDTFFQSNIAGGGLVNFGASDSTTQVGWTAGGGLEYKFGQWSLKGEALYYDLGTHSLAANCLTAAGASCSIPVTAPPTIFTTNFKDQGVMARVGLNYHFNWLGGPIATRY